jgi:hypothetical protein
MFDLGGMCYRDGSNERLEQINKVPGVGGRFQRYSIGCEQVLVRPIFKCDKGEAAGPKYDGLLRINGSDGDGALVHI